MFYSCQFTSVNLLLQGRMGEREIESKETQVSRSTQMEDSVSQPWLPIKITLSPNAPEQ